MVRRIEDPRQNDLGLIEIPRTFHAPASYVPCNDYPELEGITAIDFETKDPGIGEGRGSSWAIGHGGVGHPLGEGFVCGVAICSSRSKMYYPLKHAAGNIERDDTQFWYWLRYQLEKPSVTCVMANAVYDTGWLRRHRIAPANPPIDVQVMAFLLDEHRKSYSLSNLARDYLHRDKGTQSLVSMARALHIPKPMENMDKLPAWVVEPYALDDVDLTYCLYWHFLPQIAAQELNGVLKLESDCALVAVDMRWQGVRVDQSRLELLGERFAMKREGSLEMIRSITGIAIAPFDNIAAIKALREENSAVTLGQTETGRDSVDRFVLQRIGSPVANLILDARRYEKARGTFVESLGKHIYRGRIHAEFHSTRNNSSNDDDVFGNDSMYGAGSGRWASSNPNLQNIPNRDEEIGPAVRACFMPEEGERWCKLDYASQEPRLTVHFAHLANQRGAAAMVERFNAEPFTDLHGECSALMGVPRSHAKTINLALTYGQQGAALCQQLGLPTKMITTRNGRSLEVAGDEGQRLLDRHFEAVPFIRGVFDLAKATATQRGYVKTLSGRRIRFEKYPDGNYARVHKALNGVIQGSAADQMKMALVALRREGLSVNLTVHDEADRSVPLGYDGEAMVERMVEIMESIVQLSVPFVVDAKTGDSWGDCK